jgi:dolichol-phosphate mannosyltransferase
MLITVLPAYNEASCIGDLLNNFIIAFEGNREIYRVIVVNDGSVDNTEEVVLGFKNKIDIELVNHPQNRGLAEAMKTGLQRAVETIEDEDVIITMDADNTHPPELILKMVELIQTGNDVVIASRYQKGAKVIGLSLYRKILSAYASILFRLILPVKGVKDYSCGYRAYRGSLLKRAFKDYGNNFITERGFSCMVDILLKLKKYEPKVKEVPLILRYDQKKSLSKMKVGNTIKQTLWLLLRRRFGLLG